MKSLIIGTIGNESHEASVRDAFVIGYNESVTAYGSGSNITTTDVEVHSTVILDFQAEFDYCRVNNIPILINSYTGVASRISVAQSNYPDVTLFMPAGTNAIDEIVHLDIPQVVCITGAGDVDNETADNVEFISHDPIGNDEQDYSSFSNGYIAGQIAFIAETLNCSIWEARYRAMQTGSENGIWDEVNGFGFIDVSAAIAFTGTILADPFILEQELISIMQPVNGYNFYKIPHPNQIISAINPTGVRLLFGADFINKEKIIYRKNFSETEFVQIAQTTGNEYLDTTITRRPKPHTYKIIIGNEAHFLEVLFCSVDRFWVK